MDYRASYGYGPYPPSMHGWDGMAATTSEWDMVIKVKHGDVLRRFSVRINGNSMNLDMNTLRAKIIDLFNFSSDADLILTYTDIDGELVTLSNDDEFRDAAIQQRLNPLRINVQLNNSATANPLGINIQVNDSTTANSQSETRLLLDDLPDKLKTIFQSVPEPLHETLSKISQDVVSQATASVPVLVELAKRFSKLDHSHLSSVSGSSSASHRNPNGMGSKETPFDLLSEAKMFPTDNTTDLNLDKSSDLPKNDRETHGAETAATPSNGGLPTNIQFAGFPATSIETASGKDCVDQNKGKSVAAPAVSTIPVVDKESLMKQSDVGLSTNIRFVPVTSTWSASSKDSVGQNKGKSVAAPAVSTVPVVDQDRKMINGNTGNEFASGGCSGKPASDTPPAGLLFPDSFARRGFYGFHDGLAQTFHRGITCDGCGMYPIVGPRYKSIVQEGYDLCSVCFSEIGNNVDYIRIDRPQHQSPRSCRGFIPPLAFHGYGTGLHKEKLESRFIQDVTILDGTLVAPSTAFTKIWRMRNSGSIPWPRGTKLVWVGGDHFAKKCWVDLEDPGAGFPVDGEIDVAVDFEAPSKPGRYISYWRLSTRRGKKFGQRIWVLIQVDNPESNSQSSNASADEVGANIDSINGEVYHAVAGSPDTKVEPVKNPANEIPEFTEPVKQQQPMVPGITTPIMPKITYSASSGLMETVPVSFYPTIDTSPVPPMDSYDASYPATGSLPIYTNAPPTTAVPDKAGATLDFETEQALLKDLEAIGFTQVELNMEILRKNDYDLEGTVNDLCSIRQWNPLMELEEMGFWDKEMNKKLLVKNGGSIKRTVLDLLNGWGP